MKLEPSQPAVGGGAVIREGGKLDLVKRGVEPSMGDGVFLGAMELVEPVRDAAIREAKEELGLEIELIDDRPLDVFNNLILDKVGRLRYHYMLLQFWAHPREGTLQPTSNVTDAR